MDKPTARQLQVLTLIGAALRTQGRPPTLRELGRGLGVASTNAVSDHLRALERKGLVLRDRAVARGLRLTTDGQAACPQTSATESCHG